MLTSLSRLTIMCSTNQAAAAEKNAREKEEAFNRDQVAQKRSDELNETLQKLTEEGNILDKSIHPLNASRLTKESKRDAMRKSNGSEEAILSEELRGFEKDAQRLTDIVDKIEEYVRLNKERDMEQIEAELLNNVNMMKEREAELEAMKPVIDQLRKQVDNSERQKLKILVRNRLVRHIFCQACIK